MRDTGATSVVLIVVLLVVSGCAPGVLTPPPPTETPPTSTPITPMPESGDVVIEGQSGPKRGDATPVPGLPKKDSEERLPPIKEGGGLMPPPEKIEQPEPGSFDKPVPEKLPGALGEGPKKERDLPPWQEPYARVHFRVVMDRIRAETFQVLPGPLIASTSIDGEWIYVVTIDEKPVATGSFRDPLVAVALPSERKQGYLAIPQTEGQFAISLPAELLQPELLRASRITFYILDPSTPYDTPLTVETVPRILERSKPVAQVEGLALFELYLKTR